MDQKNLKLNLKKLEKGQDELNKMLSKTEIVKDSNEINSCINNIKKEASKKNPNEKTLKNLMNMVINWLAKKGKTLTKAPKKATKEAKCRLNECKEKMEEMSSYLKEILDEEDEINTKQDELDKKDTSGQSTKTRNILKKIKTSRSLIGAGELLGEFIISCVGTFKGGSKVSRAFGRLSTKLFGNAAGKRGFERATDSFIGQKISTPTYLYELNQAWYGLNDTKQKKEIGSDEDWINALKRIWKLYQLQCIQKFNSDKPEDVESMENLKTTLYFWRISQYDAGSKMLRDDYRKWKKGMVANIRNDLPKMSKDDAQRLADDILAIKKKVDGVLSRSISSGLKGRN